MPEEHSVVHLLELFELGLLAVAGNFKDLRRNKFKTDFLGNREIAHVFDFEGVHVVRGGVGVAHVGLQGLELLGCLVQHLHLGLELLVVGVDGVLLAAVVLLRGEQVERNLDFEQAGKRKEARDRFRGLFACKMKGEILPVQHFQLALDVVGIVEDRRGVHAEVVGDEGEEAVGGVQELGIGPGSGSIGEG